MKISIYQKLGIQTLLIINPIIISGARSNETQLTSSSSELQQQQEQQQNTCQSDNTDSAANCKQQFDEIECASIPLSTLEEMYWGELTPECQQYFIKTEDHSMEKWDKGELWDELHPASQQYWLDSGENADEWEIVNFEWMDLPPSRREYWKRRGWNEAAWTVGDESMKTFVSEEELDWEELPPDRQEYWIERGYNKEKWESSVDYAGLEKKGHVFNPRLAMEDLDQYKKAFEDVVGGSVYEYMFQALNSSSLREEGIFTPEEWDSEYYDWAMFAGSKGTSTSMHYDNDLFNFLYVT